MKLVLYSVILSLGLMTTQGQESELYQDIKLTEFEDAAFLLAGPKQLAPGQYQTPPVYNVDNHLFSIDECSLVPIDEDRSSYKIKFRCEDLMNYLEESHHFYLSGNALNKLKGSFLLISSRNIDDSLYLRWDISIKDYSKEDDLVRKWAHQQRLKGKYVFEIIFL